ESIRKHTLTMTALLNNMITVAGLETGVLTFNIEPMRLDSVLDEMLWLVRTALAAKNLELFVSLPDDLPDVLADPVQLRNALHQLLDNARLYTDFGSVSIRATQQEALVRIDISDTGCGIGDELREQLFTRFMRGADGINSHERGIGLG